MNLINSKLFWNSRHRDQTLKTMVKRNINQKLRLRNFDVRHGRNETENRKETSAVPGMRVTIVPRNQNPTQPHFLSPQCHEVDARKRSIRGKSNHGAILRQPCRFYLKGTCTRSPCEYWHPPECQFFKTETGCEAGDECFFPHHEVVEQPNKKAPQRLLFTKKKRKRRQECCGDCENCITIGLRLARLGTIGFSKKQTATGEARCKVLGSIRKVRFTQSTLRQSSIRENKGPSLGKMLPGLSTNSSTSPSPTSSTSSSQDSVFDISRNTKNVSILSCT